MTHVAPPRLTASLVLALLGSLAPGAAQASGPTPYVPPAAKDVPGYDEGVMPCKISRNDMTGRSEVRCTDRRLETKGLRELSILRNTIYARYGWDGYRKPWLRAHFHAQPWFKANPAFSYKLLSEADRKNAHFVAVREQALTETDLLAMRDEIYARRGKVWNDVPRWPLKGGKVVRACQEPKDVDRAAPGYEVGPNDEPPTSLDCRYRTKAWYKPDAAFTDAKLTPEDRIELGLISRALGSFALDESGREKSEASLDRLLTPAELRQLSMRDLRLLRNTIYARRGRPFKSEVLRDHFSGMSWYKVDPGYSDARLTANDQRNIALIKTVENEFGGPLSDEDWLTEPAIDGA